MPVTRRMGENVWKNQSIFGFSFSCSSVRNLVIRELLLKGRKSHQSSQNNLFGVKCSGDFAFEELCCFRIYNNLVFLHPLYFKDVHRRY